MSTPAMTTASRRATRLRSASPASIGRRILAASDGTAESLGALRIAAALQRQTNGHIEVVTAIQPLPVASIPALDLQPPPFFDDSRRRMGLASLRRQCRALHPSRAWSFSAVIEWPTEAILEAAARGRSSLVVIGIGRHRPIDRILSHETAIAVVRRATVPVLAVAPRASRLPRHAVAAVDFSDSSIEAARVAAALLAPNGRLTLVHVSPFPQTTRRDGATWNEVYETGAADRLRILEDEMRANGVVTDAVIRRGDAAKEVINLARRRGADLIAVGGHKQGAVDRMLVGSVTRRVLRAAPTSVLVVPQKTPVRRN